MKDAVVKIQAASLTKTLKVRIVLSGMQMLQVRFWLGSVLLRLGARVLGCGVEILPQTEPAVQSPSQSE